VVTILAGAHGCGRGAGENSPISPSEAIKKAKEEEYAAELRAKAAAKTGDSVRATKETRAAEPRPQPRGDTPTEVDPIEAIKKAREEEYAEEQRARAGHAAKPVKPGTPQKSRQKEDERPQDVANWKRDDYYSAKRDGDPQLAAAVTWLGERFAGKESAAELLTRLLDSPANNAIAGNQAVLASENQKDVPHRANADDVKLTEAIVAALVANGTPRARKTLESLITGDLVTSDPQASAAAAVEAMLDRPCAENEDLLFRVVASPGKAAVGTRTVIDTEKLRRTAIVKIASVASESFRTRLAEHMIKPDTPQAICDQLWACLKEPRPENLGPKIVLYRGNTVSPATKECLEQEFVVQSDAAVRTLLGIRSPRPRAAGVSDAVVMYDPYRVVERFWGTDLTAALERRLRILDSLENGGRLAMLASTVPSPLVRAALLRTLEKHWDEGPEALESLSVHDGTTVEPGFVTVVKMLPRKDTTAPVTTSAGPGKGDGELHAAAAAKREEKRRKERTSQEWMDFSRNVVRVLCQRLHEAAQAELNVEGDFFPFKLCSRADVVAAYRLNWPDDLRGKVAAASLLRVRYVRVEQRIQPSKVLAHYRGQLPDRKEHPLSDGWWLDSLTRDQERNSVCSIDVLLTKAKANAAIRSPADQEQLLIVELLSVECAEMAEGEPLSANE
jgi:hypothetical protein